MLRDARTPRRDAGGPIDLGLSRDPDRPRVRRYLDRGAEAASTCAGTAPCPKRSSRRLNGLGGGTARASWPRSTRRWRVAKPAVFETRLARLERAGADTAVLHTLERIIGEQGLVEFRPALEIVAQPAGGSSVRSGRVRPCQFRQVISAQSSARPPGLARRRHAHHGGAHASGACQRAGSRSHVRRSARRVYDPSIGCTNS